METVAQDVRYGLRLLRRQPGFSVIAIVTLTLGIGLSTALASVLDAALLRPLPYPNPDQLVRVAMNVPQRNGRVVQLAVSQDDVQVIRSAAHRHHGDQHLAPRVPAADRRRPDARTPSRSRDRRRLSRPLWRDASDWPRHHGRRSSRRRAAGGPPRLRLLAATLRRIGRCPRPDPALRRWRVYGGWRAAEDLRARGADLAAAPDARLSRAHARQRRRGRGETARGRGA